MEDAEQRVEDEGRRNSSCTAGDQRRGGLNYARGHVGNALITLCASFSLMNVSGTDGTTGFIDEAKDSRARARARARPPSVIFILVVRPSRTRRKIKVPISGVSQGCNVPATV